MIIKSKLPNLEIPNKTFHDFLFDEWEKFKDDVAIIDNDSIEQFTFQDIKEKAEYIAKSLMYMRVEKSEVVLLVMDWSPAAIYISLGVSMAGAAIQIVSPKLQAWEMQFPVRESESRFVFSDSLGLREIDKLMKTLNREYRIICTGTRDFANGYPIIEDLAFAAAQDLPYHKIDPETDIVYLPYSSGIHGKRKGIVTTHRIMVAKTMVMWNPTQHTEFQRGDTTLTMIPLHKQIGLDAMYCALLNGLTVVTEKNFCVHSFMTCIQRYKIRAVHLTPYLMNLMMFEAENHAYNVESLERVLTGADAVTEELYEDFTACFPSVKRITQTYGMTEVGLISRNYKDDTQFTHSCGQLTANLELKVLDVLTGKLLGPREKGQICVKGLPADSPYLNNPRATEEHFIDGWRKTGDIGYFDEDENIYIVDKLKEMIKVFGYQVIPKEIETLLLTHQSVEEAAVVAINNELSGERPVAFVVLKKGHQVTEDDLKDYVNKRVIRYKHLVRINITQFLPRSACGTLLRRLLAEAAVMSVASIADVEKEFAEEVKHALAT
ncbi:hypothetical protein GCK72_021974 [Caenorhabditis remanei]|uniref:Uncharacterized protein n=1 Tax=Caenorhabditis remanei TaxID=31234 RepID=E3MEX4_CAERE|nr:hypothetical protein GCK72_021974 [Caenorhabditis remanei]EFP00762.1 hypothetical protein CRE_21134 [Caenorhabditis remanei]KAF1755405.1 hypothetical protein GCK72_021974 [Caenorhabditis remanei]